MEIYIAIREKYKEDKHENIITMIDSKKIKTRIKKW